MKKKTANGLYRHFGSSENGTCKKKMGGCISSFCNAINLSSFTRKLVLAPNTTRIAEVSILSATNFEVDAGHSFFPFFFVFGWKVHITFVIRSMLFTNLLKCFLFVVGRVLDSFLVAFPGKKARNYCGWCRVGHLSLLKQTNERKKRSGLVHLTWIYVTFHNGILDYFNQKKKKNFDFPHPSRSKHVWIQWN